MENFYNKWKKHGAVVLNLFNRLAVFFIELYKKFFAVYLGGNCRYYPSCSNYSKEAFKEYHFFKALYLSTKRLLRCHPLASSGYDPLPVKKRTGACHESSK